MVQDWHEVLGPTVDVVGVTPPGRNTRINEPTIDRMSTLLTQVLPLVKNQMNLPTVLMGYSIGALVAYELALQLEKAGSPPVGVIAAAALPPQIPRKVAARFLGDADFLKYLISLDGMPPDVVKSPELVEFLLPMLRADITLGETYQPSNERLHVPIACINGLRDRHVNVEGIARWSELTTDWRGSHWVDGRHFFVRDQSTEFLRILAECLTRLRTPERERRLAATPR